MKIVKQIDTMNKEFGEIEVGEIFEYCGQVYMKINEIVGEDDCNAINLKNAYLKYFPFDEEILHLSEAKLVY